MAAEQNGAQIRPPPPGSYASPQSYPSPQMQPSYAYPPPQGQHGDAYRHSPAASNASIAPVSLPPLRSIEGQQPPPPPQLMPQSGNQQLAQAMPPMHGYYAHPPPGMSHPGQAMAPYARYAPIPQGTPMSGGRGKKEIKRRTKTGCLTCRKRRIKCDEQHPVCRNCQKSKRECLGYDPIFKQQTGPQALQPAPGGPTAITTANSHTATTSASPTPSTATSGAAPYSPAQPSYPPLQSATYPPYPKNATAPAPAQQHQPYEPNAAIDPALAGSPKAERRSSNHDNTLAPLATGMDGVKIQPARQLSVAELFQVGQYGPYEISGHESLDQATLTEIQNYYRNDLAPGLDRLVETNWFTASGLAKLLATRSLCVELATLLKHFTQLGAQNFEDAEHKCRATEARMIWHLLNLCTPDSAEPSGTKPAQIDLDLPHGRLEVLECLLTNRILNEQNLKLPAWDQSWSREKTEDLMFWSALAKFVARRSDDQAAAGEKDKYLMQCRNMLNGRENRDVIYSIMVTKHLGWRVPGFPTNMHPEQGGEGSYVNKVYIAHKFITDEAGYRGTNHPIQRICDMAIRSWSVGW